MVVVVLDPGRDPGPGRGRGLLDAAQLELQGRVPRFDDRVVQRRAGPAMDWEMESRWQAALK